MKSIIHRAKHIVYRLT